MKQLLLCILLLISVSGAEAQSENYYFRHLKVEDGLSQSTVWCTLQDSKGLMWFGTKDGLNRYDGSKFRQFRHEINSVSGLGNNFIRTLYEDVDGNIWVGTSAGVYIYDTRSESFSKFAATTSSNVSVTGEVNDIKQGEDGVVWIAVNWQGLFRYDTKSGVLKLYECFNTEGRNVLLNSWSLVVERSNARRLWIGTHGGGLIEMDTQTEKFLHYDFVFKDDIYKILDNGDELLVGTSINGLHSVDKSKRTIKTLKGDLFVRDILPVDDKLWLATESGIIIYDRVQNSSQQIKYNSSDPYSISSNAIYCIYRDREEALWIGTYFGGVNYLPKQTKHFDKYYPTDAQYFASNAVREFCQDGDGNLWIGSEDAGLYRFDPRKKEFRHYPLSYHNIHGLCLDGDKLFVGMFTSGVDILDTKSGQIVTKLRAGVQDNTLSDNNVFAICKISNGEVWIGTIYGLNIYDTNSGQIRRVKQLNSYAFVYDIYEDSQKRIWVATYNDGVFCYDSHADKWRRLLYNPNDANSLCYDRVISIFQDSRGLMWFGTEGGGVSMYNSETEIFKNYTTANGLPNNVVYKVMEDGSGNMWMSTNKGLAMLTLHDEKFTIYTVNDGLLSDQFNYKSGIKSRDGKLYFGTIAGFVSFDPSSFAPSVRTSQVVLTNMQLFNEDVVIGAENSPLTQSLLYTERIEFEHWQSTMSFDFTSLTYCASTTNRYAYRMAGYDNDWIELPSNQRITYSRVPPGEYILEIKAANSEGVWSDSVTQLTVVINPPIWATTMAYFLYLLMTATAVWLIFRHFNSKIKARNRQRIQAVRFANQQNLHRAKIEFFTTIAHEIRTPLTLIKAPFENIVNGTLSNEEYQQNRQIVESNINRLLNLVNQLLDFRKVENEGFTLYCSDTDVNQIVERVTVQFKSIVLQRNIEFTLNLPSCPVHAFVDNEALTKIISNLIANAVKFAEHRIEVKLCSDGGEFEIRVENDGKLIPVASRESIFMPFHQVRNATTGQGTGLGLPIVKHLVELHRGRVCVDVDGGLNSFVVRIPFVESVATVTEGEILSPEQSSADILIVEDDDSLRNFVAGILSKRFRVCTASNGVEAIEVLMKRNIDIVVTDVMMPEMDGIELCNYIKNSDEYSHIAIIILSARADVDSKIRGLESGIDAYLDKPFSVDHLMVQIENLIANRSKLREIFATNPLTAPQTLTTNKADQKFLNRVTDIIYENISDELFSVDSLASQLNMSRSSLHRKIKGISQMAPNDFIRVTRLKRAAEYLLEDNSRIGEISYIVGFKSPSYFSKCFKQQFGVLPKDFVGGH